jgi:acyl dehydratase
MRRARPWLEDAAVNLFGEPAHVGRHCGSNEYVASPDIVRFYSEALDDANPLYERFAPPLLHHSECFQFVGQWYLKNLFGNLHARQEWQLFDAIPVGARLRTRSTIVDRYQKRGRDYVVNETDLIADDAGEGRGRLLVRGRTHQSFLPPDRTRAAGGGFVVDEGTARGKEERSDGSQDAARRVEGSAPKDGQAQGEALPSVRHTIDQRRCWMFSGPGANYHNDAEQAKKLGFPRIVVQGMMTTCFISQIMLERFGEGWLRGGRMDMKLTNVVWCDDTVVVSGRIRETRPEGGDERVFCDVWADKLDGTRVIVGEASART